MALSLHRSRIVTVIPVEPVFRRKFEDDEEEEEEEEPTSFWRISLS